MLLAQAGDRDGPLAGLSVHNLQLTGGGALVAAGSGTWLYVPALNDDSGVRFSYTISDGTDTVAGLATLDIIPVNDLPNDGNPVRRTLAPIAEDSPPLSITQAMLLAGVSDPDGPGLQALNLRQTGGLGQLVDNGNGSWTYTPAANDDTAATFSFSISDGLGQTAGTATLDLSPVNDAPTTAPVTLPAIVEDSAGLTITAAMLLANARDVDNAVSGLTIGQLRVNGQGSLVANADGSWRYKPAANDDSAVTFSYTIGDGSATVAGSATLDILPLSDPPASPAIELTPVSEGSKAVTITQAMLLAQASDADGNVLVAQDLQLSSPRGALVDQGDGSWLYTPDTDDDTLAAFSYTISDGEHTVPGSATLDLLPVNDAPLARADEAQTRIGSGIFIGVLANDADIDGGPLAVSAFSPAPNGSLSISADGQGLLYTPNPGFTGFDRFSYTVSDGAGGSATGSVRVLVASHLGTPGNDVPLGTPQADVIAAGDGHDRVLAHAGADYVDGGRGNDTLTGGAGADTLLGGDGHDTFIASAADLAGDSIDGGDGIDTLLITDAIAFLPASFTLESVEQLSFPGALMVAHSTWLDLSATSLAGSGNQIIGGAAASRIIGTRSNDRITDTAGHDDLRGAEGHDTLIAGTGQDTLYGGPGNDTLVGGFLTMGDGLRDTFVFNTALNAATNVDTILGFEANGRDVIALDSAVFAAIGPTLEASEFRSAIGGLANDANDYILFDPATGALYYDADGHGAGARVQFATLSSGLIGTPDASDFTIGPFPG